jgi:hypothetical protein
MSVVFLYSLILFGWFGLVWFGLVWFGLVWFGLVWFVWYGMMCLVIGVITFLLGYGAVNCG